MYNKSKFCHPSGNSSVSIPLCPGNMSGESAVPVSIPDSSSFMGPGIFASFHVNLHWFRFVKKNLFSSEKLPSNAGVISLCSKNTGAQTSLIVK